MPKRLFLSLLPLLAVVALISLIAIVFSTITPSKPDSGEIGSRAARDAAVSRILDHPIREMVALTYRTVSDEPGWTQLEPLANEGRDNICLVEPGSTLKQIGTWDDDAQGTVVLVSYAEPQGGSLEKQGCENGDVVFVLMPFFTSGEWVP